jgi:superoxide reductase
MEMKFYKCNQCEGVLATVAAPGISVTCCGEEMVELVPNTVDAAVEKHVPVIEIKGHVVTVKVGSVPHPMLPEHYIQFITLKTKEGFQLKELKPGDKPEATFALADGDKVISSQELCNIHGLWEKKI